MGKLLLDGLLVTQNGRLVAHDCIHVCSERVHVLADGDQVFLGLIPVRIKSGGQVIDLVFQCSRRKDSPPPRMVVVVGVGWMNARPLPGTSSIPNLNW